VFFIFKPLDKPLAKLAQRRPGKSISQVWS